MKKILFSFFAVLIFVLNNAYAIEIESKQAFLMDADTGEVLFEKDADVRVFPSSMTKIMASYIIFEKLDDKELNLNQTFQVTKEAWQQDGSRMFINIGSRVSVDDLLRGLIIISGNDAAYTLAEGSASTVERFVNLMNKKAEQMGLKNTHFTNPIGFSEDGHYMSVRDTAIISQQLIKDFPEYYLKYFAIPDFTYNNIKQVNRNFLIKEYPGVDGIKTGHTEAGGYALASSALKDGRRLIAVVNGASSERERLEESKRLFNFGFETLTRFKIYSKDEILEVVKVKHGRTKTVDAIVKEDIYASDRKRENIEIKISINEKLKAPIEKDQKIGTLTVKTQLTEREYGIYAKEAIAKAGFLRRFF